jgi:hypothetical protein
MNFSSQTLSKTHCQSVFSAVHAMLLTFAFYLRLRIGKDMVLTSGGKDMVSIFQAEFSAGLFPGIPDIGVEGVFVVLTDIGAKASKGWIKALSVDIQNRLSDFLTEGLDPLDLSGLHVESILFLD